MGRFDRYILFQLLVLFGFFSLVLVSVYWVNQAVRLFDSLIADGQNLSVFLEFSALTLPRIMQLVLPVSAFVATLYIFNRMIGESEMVVLQTAGLSAARLLRPVLAFGVLTALLVGILGSVLAPLAQARFIDRQDQVQDDLTARFLRAGEFIHPAPGLTVFIREITDLGEFRDLFLQDRSAAEVEVTYTARTALLVRSDGGPRLVMFDGMAQTLDQANGRLATVRFSEFTYDVSALIAEAGLRRVDVRELPTAVLITADQATADRLNIPLAHMRFEGHDRLAQALFVIFTPLIAAAALMLGTFSRFGVWRQIMVAVALVLPLQILRNAAEAAARDDVTLWPLAYGQPAIAAAIALTLAGLAMWPLRGLRGIPA